MNPSRFGFLLRSREEGEREIIPLQIDLTGFDCIMKWEGSESESERLARLGV